MNLAIVILNYNGRHLLERFLPKVIEFSQGAEVFIADNKSSDDSVKFVMKNFPTVKIVINNSNLQFAKGYNEALKKIKADIYCLLNSDVQVTLNWINPCIEMFKNNNVTIVQPKIMDYNDKERFEFAGAAGGMIDKFGYPYCRGRIFNHIEKDQGQFDVPQKIFWASGACMFIRSQEFWHQNGFDEDYIAHQEEIDLCWRIQQIGCEVWYCPNSIVYHMGGATLNYGNPRKTFLNFRNSLFSLLKNVPTKRVFFVIFIRLVLDFFAALYFLVKGEFSTSFSIICAHLSFFCMSFKIFKKRALIKPKLKNYFTAKSIVLDYFIFGKKLSIQLR